MRHSAILGWAAAHVFTQTPYITIDKWRSEYRIAQNCVGEHCLYNKYHTLCISRFESNTLPDGNRDIEGGGGGRGGPSRPPARPPD